MERWLWIGWSATRPLRPGQPMRSHGLGYAESERLIRHHTLLQAHRCGWIGMAGLAALAARLLCAFADPAVPAWLGRVLPGCATLCTGLRLIQVQRAARPRILRDADALRDGRRTAAPR
ncbi:MAG TPA: hypothetical protein VGU03_13275 [Frateuria sp.]|uniref:hypothetical protein n=1 Tax=Frateuria sp. TaxID=2211372 RepID=UPI002DF413D2|nr:hypothetical protein [Frateuria sp.]